MKSSGGGELVSQRRRRSTSARHLSRQPALVVAGSLWIMANLNANMTLPRDLMDMRLQH
jgi:hypothetical protein